MSAEKEPHAKNPVSRATRKVLFDIGSTGIWQAAGKLAQVFGMLHAMDCLGVKNAGFSGEVMGVAMMLQVILTLGIDVVAVRHIAAKSQTLRQIVPVIFSTRLILHGIIACLWTLITLLASLSPVETLAWLIGGFYFLVIGMNYQWYYQATERMPALSRIQTLTTFAISAYFLLVFRPGQAAGMDLLVLAMGHGIVTAWVWFRIRQEMGAPMLTMTFGADALKLLKEGQANWLFGVAYNALTLLGLLLIPYLLPASTRDTELGMFRPSNQLALALQLILTYVGYIFYPKIVAWRQQQLPDFRPRVLGLALIVWIFGIVSSGLIWWIGEPFFKLALKDPDFHPGFQILPIMVMAKFIGMASGFMTWGLLAEHKDWLAVRCCVLPVLITAALHWRFVPDHGFIAAGWLYALGEMLLFLACTTAFLRLKLANSDQA
jgi:O-antigen/teichoic acid export membrane protein